MTYRRDENDMYQALERLCNNYPTIPGTDVSGKEAIARLLGVNYKTLCKKLSPLEPTYKITWEEVNAIMELCAMAGMPDAYAPLEAMNWHHNMVAFPRAEIEHLTDESIHIAGVEALTSAAAAVEEGRKSLEDGHVCPEEKARTLKKFRTASSKLAAWFHRFCTRAGREEARRQVEKAGAILSDLPR